MSNICWICNKLFDFSNDKVRDHCNATGKFRGAFYWNCNVNLKISKTVPVKFHNLKVYDSHLIFKEWNKFNVKITAIPNGLEKYVDFTVNKNLVFIGSMQFFIGSMQSEDFKYLSEEFSGEQLRLVKEKRIYPYQYMNSFKKFKEDKLPNKSKFFSSLKRKCISEQEYDRASMFGKYLK